MDFNDSNNNRVLRERIFNLMIHKKDINKIDRVYNAVSYGFYDFQKKLNMSKEDYEKFLISLYHDDLIKIDMHDKNDYAMSTISATSRALEYYSEEDDSISKR